MRMPRKARESIDNPRLKAKASVQRFTAATIALTLSLGTGCAARGSSPDSHDSLTVFAAASLKNTFTELGHEFEATHPGVQVRFNFGGSADLAAQLQQGAPADVFASADTATMAKAVADDLIEGEPVAFARNSLAIAVPPDNPAKVRSLQDLTKPNLKLVVCAPEVPCGAAAITVADKAGMTIQPVSEEQSVTDVLNKVQTGEADAGLVYVTDVQAASGRVRGINFSESSAAVNVYPIGALAHSSQASLAADFIALITGPQGQEVLARAGFAKP